jgi:hypothetical protein
MRYEDRREPAVKTVNRLIADVEAKRLRENKELAEVIVACIRETASDQLQTPKMAACSARAGTCRLGYSYRHSLTPNDVAISVPSLYCPATVPAPRIWLI